LIDDDDELLNFVDDCVACLILSMIVSLA
jgi:hypothetical protein